MLPPRLLRRCLAPVLLIAGGVACQHPPAKSPVAPAAPVLTGFEAMTRAEARRISELTLRTTATTTIFPIPLDSNPDGPRHGALYTPYLLSALAVRAERAHGRPVESRPLGGGVADEKPVFVAAGYPLTCGSVVSPPIDVRLVGTTSSSPSRREAQRLQPVVNDTAGIARLLPGEVLPKGSMVGAFRTPSGGETSVEIDYGPPLCEGMPKTLIFPIVRERFTGPGPSPIVLKLPNALASGPPIATQVMAVVDVNGRLAFPGLASGPIELADLAEAAVRDQEGRPDHQNGLALPSLAMRQVIFTATGDPPPQTRPGPLSQEALADITRDNAERNGRIALELARQGAVTPIPFDAPGETPHAFGYDNGMLGTLTVRRLLSMNAGLTVAELPPGIGNGQALIVAVPVVCGDRRIAPVRIDAAFSPTAPRAPTRIVSAEEINAEYPDVRAPAGALGSFFSVPLERATVTITYAEPACPIGSPTLTLAMPKSTSARAKKGPLVLRFPDGADGVPPISFQVDAVVDEFGHVHGPRATRGTRLDLALAAEQAVAASEWEPRRINGVAVSTATGTVVQFTSTGSAQRSSVSPYVLEGFTLLERGLTRETSRCAVADDPAYGTAAQPIAVGGDDWRGVAYERNYLGALRGPAGQGVTYRIVGAEFRAATKTFLDVFELTYDGIPSPVRIYLDDYRAAPLRAPAGFTCATSLVEGPHLTTK